MVNYPTDFWLNGLSISRNLCLEWTEITKWVAIDGSQEGISMVVATQRKECDAA